MLDLIEPNVVPSTSVRTCPKCATEFRPKRKDKRFCSRECQKASSNNASRGSRYGENKARSYRHYERAMRLAEMVYSVAPHERLGVMKDILSHAPHDAGLRNILSDPSLLKAHPASDNGLFFRGRTKTISQAANAYTQMFFGVSIRTYLGKVRAGEVIEGIEIVRNVAEGPKPMTKKRRDKLLERRNRPLTSVHPCKP